VESPRKNLLQLFYDLMARQSRVEFEAVILDWDNTLHDSAAVNFAALRAVLADHGIAIEEADYRRAYTTDYHLLYQRLGLPESAVPTASDRWRELVAHAVPRLLPGAREALERLHDAGVRLALLTTGRRRIVSVQLAQLALAGEFAATVFGDGQPPRPDPAPLLQTLAQLGLPAGRAILCSDAPADMRMARSAGVRAVGVATFVATEEMLRAAGANETAPTLIAWAERSLAAP
jgi:HAD superfamily hydrolase (TIGR01509 family)